MNIPIGFGVKLYFCKFLDLIAGLTHIHICNIKENRIKGFKNTFFILHQKLPLLSPCNRRSQKSYTKKVTKMNELKIISLTFKTIFDFLPYTA